MANFKKHIVKREGHTELFDERKAYASIYSACLAVNTPTGSAELVADEVVKRLKAWLENKQEVTANDIKREIAKHLEVYSPDASYLFATHHSIN